MVLDECIATVGGQASIHVCAADVPWKTLARTAFSAISIDVTKLTAADLDGIGEWVEAGGTIMLGVLPGVAPERPVPVETVAAAAASVTDRLGFPRTVFRERVGLTPASGLVAAQGRGRHRTGPGRRLNPDPRRLRKSSTPARRHAMMRNRSAQGVATQRN